MIVRLPEALTALVLLRKGQMTTAHETPYGALD